MGQFVASQNSTQYLHQMPFLLRFVRRIPAISRKCTSLGTSPRQDQNPGVSLWSKMARAESVQYCGGYVHFRTESHGQCVCGHAVQNTMCVHVLLRLSTKQLFLMLNRQIHDGSPRLNKFEISAKTLQIMANLRQRLGNTGSSLNC